MARWTIIFLSSLMFLGCAGKSSTPANPSQPPSEQAIHEVPTPDSTQKTFSPLLSPYSTEGLITLNQYRTHNFKLNEFLMRNRKPDYFFSGPETEYQFQKIYLLYIESQNLYLFDPQLSEPYKKFHPLPPSIQERLAHLPSQRPIHAAPAETRHPQTSPPVIRTAESTFVEPHTGIEKSLPTQQPQPWLNVSILYDIPTEQDPDRSAPLYPDLYFLDKPLEELVENAYSIKYEKAKHSLKIIFPQAYEADSLYQGSKTETRKILVSRDTSNGRELSLVVPDFLPGSTFYQSTRGNMAKAFASLYQVSLPKDVREPKNLRMRYQIKLCQSDGHHQCAVRKGNVTTIRAIVIAATLYDGNSLIPIATFTLK